MSRRRGKKDNQPQGAPEWMTTYSDMVTLLLAFFVLMFAFSTVNAQKFHDAMVSMQGALGILHQGPSVTKGKLQQPASVGVQATRVVQDMAQLQQVKHMLEKSLKKNGVANVVTYTMGTSQLTVRLQGNILFDSGKADIKQSAHPVLDAIANVLVTVPNHIRVEGHTDNVPIHNSEYPTNWELSTARASNVVRYLIDTYNMDPARLSAAGYSKYHPIASNDTAAGRQKNRRVDIVILTTKKIEFKQGS